MNMTRRRIAALVTLAAVALLLTAASAGLALHFGGQLGRVASSPSKSASDATATATTSGHLIAAENAQPGTRDWTIAGGHAATVQIQGYAGAVSAAMGQTMTFYVSTQVAGTPYTVEVYRLGWYGGLGARLIATLRERGQAQGYYDWPHLRLVDCASCAFDPATHLVEANWQPSFTLTIGATWTTGLYVAKLTDAADWQAYVSFEVRGNPHAAYIVVVPDNTTAAYNDWGGYSLYHGPDGQLASRATIVSFDRPALGWRFGYGSGLSYEIDAIRWMERSGYDLAYISSSDLDQDPGQLLNHRAYISLGHDEYWSEAMRDGVEQARDAGVGLAFLGANAGYWRIRYTPDARGVADRRIVCYKDLSRDPLYGKDNSQVSGRFRDAPISRPENALVGVMYSDYITPPAGFPWTFAPQSDDLGLAQGTGLQAGTSYGCNIVGYEFDHVSADGVSPPGLQILATSATRTASGGTNYSNTAYYVAPSGALVFASGSIYWSYGLDTLHIWDIPSVSPDHTCLIVSQGHAIPQIQALMAHVMAALVVRHVAVGASGA